jgi:FkbM family methyltransferase
MIIEKIKYNLLLNFFRKKKKLLWTLTNLLFENSISTPSISVLNLSADTTFGKKNEKIFVTNDSYLTWYIINDKNFYKSFVEKIRDLTDANRNYTFVDIGANTGLLTKALLNNLENINNSYLIEPDKDNLFCLHHNLSKYKNVHTFNFALDVHDGERKLFIDKNNKGNLSFNYEMMLLKENKLSFMNSPNNYEIVVCKSVKNFFNEINNENNNENKFIVKIDVQGHDETIFQEIPENILKNTKILIIEITPLASKNFNLDKFNSKLKIFSKFTNFEGDLLSHEEVNKLIKMKTGKRSIDLIFINN